MRTWLNGGEVIRLSSTDTTTDTTVDANAVATDAVDEVREAILSDLNRELGDALVGSHIAPGVDITVRVCAEAWATTATFLRDGLGFAFFNFLSAIDWLPSLGRDMDSQVDLRLQAADITEQAADNPEQAADSTESDEKDTESEAMEQGLAGGDTRFQVFARVNDVVQHRAITVKADVDPVEMSVPSWVPVYAGANWHEREAWEMFGIDFVGHPKLRHIYLPGSFEGHPLRKDYPLLARRIKPWPGIVDVELMPTDDSASS